MGWGAFIGWEKRLDKNKQAEIMIILHFSLIKKCEISVYETDKTQIKVLFDIADKGEVVYLYENGVVKKLEK